MERVMQVCEEEWIIGQLTAENGDKEKEKRKRPYQNVSDQLQSVKRMTQSIYCKRKV